MGTHDEVTRAYFSGSEARCVLVQRSGGKGNRVTDGTVAGAFFSHHQKSIVCDAPPLPGAALPYRRLVAFVGGLDLTLGVLLLGLFVRYQIEQFRRTSLWVCLEKILCLVVARAHVQCSTAVPTAQAGFFCYPKTHPKKCWVVLSKGA